MRRRSRAAGKPAETRRRKTVKRRNAAKAAVRRSSFAGSQETKAPSSDVVTDRLIETLTQISIEHAREVGTVVIASQALSSEIVIDKLIEILMRVAIEHAGADRGLLVLLEGDAQRIEAEATAGRDRIEVRIHGTNVTTSELPVSIIQYVVRTLESVILDDASVHNQFSADHYFSQKRCRSIFCLPLVRQTKLIGVLYLENTFGSHVFTAARASLLKLLASQAAISIENARLYADLLTAQDLARKSEQRFRDFSESASDWYWETGPDHRFTTHLVSDQQLKTIGVLPDSRIGTMRWDFARDLEEEPEKWRQHIADLDAHKPFRDFRYRAASRDGSDIYIAASGKPLFDSEGRFLGYRGVGRHITAAVRAALLEEALQEAKVVGDNIAHDLRAPLTRVRLRLERGREHAATLEELRAVADQAIAGLDQSLTTITALLRITEIENSRRREGFSEVQLAPLIHEVGDLYDPIAEDKGVTLRVETPEGACVHGDRDLLFEAVTNLVDNAVKFTPEGGRVELALLYQEGETVIRVSDTGPGIPEIEREAVTQRFYRSDKTRNTKGLGLGLSMVAAIIKLHSFRLRISAGSGCTAEIACPGVH
jgi:PAS domain S-box-containing protein